MATRREIAGRVVSDAETAELVVRLAAERTTPQGVVSSFLEFMLSGSAASFSMTNLGRLRVETSPELTGPDFFTDADKALWHGDARYF